jgi:quercetin dioxygenase-like cupin family protein
MKLYRTNEYIDKENPTPGRRYRTEVLTESDDAKRLAGIFVILPAGDQVPYHYHASRESLIYILSGEGIEKVERQEFPVKAGDVLFMPANEKHTIINRSDKDIRYLEFYAPIERDFIEVDE